MMNKIKQTPVLTKSCPIKFKIREGSANHSYSILANLTTIFNVKHIQNVVVVGRRTTCRSSATVDDDQGNNDDDDKD